MSIKKGINVVKSGFSIEIEIDRKLREHCEENLLNKSKLVNRLISEYLEKIKK